MYVIYIPSEDGFYGGVVERSLLVTDYSSCMHFNNIFCNDWYNALIGFGVNDLQFVVMKVEFDNYV